MLGLLLGILIVLDPAGLFRVEGVPNASRFSPEQLSDVFVIQVDAAGLSDVPPLLGSYSVLHDALVFTPRYPLQRGLSYRATLTLPDQEPIVRHLTVPKPESKPTTVVEHIYPSTNVLPENQLKFYIHFSAPMARGEAYRRVRLLDDSGKVVQLPFLELSQELWDVEGRRFTLYFDPGRIKSGLTPHNEAGLALRAGSRYTLVIDPEWRDAQGEPLKTGFRKTFEAGPSDRRPIDVSTWRIAAPKTATADAISIEFPEPLDRALLEHELEVMDASGNVVDGSIRIDRNEMRWSLKPSAPWKDGTYTVLVGTVLADLAGNMVDRPFEIDALEKEKRRRNPVSLFFEVKK